MNLPAPEFLSDQNTASVNISNEEKSVNSNTVSQNAYTYEIKAGRSDFYSHSSQLHVEANENDSIVLPVVLFYFYHTVDRRKVTLFWGTSFEINNDSFEIERKNIYSEEWSRVGSVTGHGTSAVTNYYTFTDDGLNTGNYSYRLKQIDHNANFEYFLMNKTVKIGLPAVYKVSQNYPNPFNPDTKIDYVITNDGKVTLKLYDISGKEVASLLDKNSTPGYYTIDFNGADLPSGIYIYKYTASGFESDGSRYDFTDIKSMLLIK
ncbi:MAG: T9SS type A sorting domain-containing protein [Ignavibacteria bacterium]|nr:T9SS type A sorting domain-containing protein [Ignavibacteria bacterium]